MNVKKKWGTEKGFQPFVILMVFQPRPLLVKRLLIAAGSLVLLVALIVFGFATFIQSDYLKAKLSTAGSSKLGRELVIDGPLDIDWRWSGTRIHAQDVRISNMPDAKDPNMLEIAQLDLTFKPLKFLFGRLELPNVVLTEPTLILERAADGKANWDFPALTSGKAAAETVIPNDRHDFPIIGEIKITDGHVIVRDALNDLNIDLKLSSLSGSGKDKDDAFILEGTGTLSDRALTIKASGGSLLNLRDSSKDYPLTADISMDDTYVKINGTFKDPLRMKGVDADLALKGTNLANLYHMTGIPLPPTPAYIVNGHLNKTGDMWTFDIPDGKIGNSPVAAKGTYDVSGERGFLKAEIASSKMYLDDLGGFIGLKPRGNETVTPSNKLFPDVPINLTRLRNSDLNVHLKADSLVAKGWPLQSLDVVFDLDEGLLKLDPIDAGIAGGTMKGSITLNGREDVPHVATDLMLRRLSVKQFFGDTRFESLSAGRFGGRIKLEGDGKSLAEVLADSNGRLSALMAGGQVSLMIVEAAGLDIAQFTPLLLGSDKTTNVRCAIGDFAVSKGVLNSDIFVFDTTDSNIEGSALIDLRTESIDAEVEAHPKDNSILAARTPLTIKGPLKKPNIGIAPGKLAAKGAGAALLAVLNPLAAVIPFIDPGDGEDTDCRGLIREVRARYGGDIAGPTPAEAPVKAQ